MLCARHALAAPEAESSNWTSGSHFWRTFMSAKHATPRIVGREEWERAHAELLVREKAHTRAGDALAAERRRLPMTPVEPVKVMGPGGPIALHDVFEGRSMLLVYFFMWNKGAPHHKQCPGCTHSQAAMNSSVCAYLAERDVSYAVFSAGAMDEIVAYRDFMGWKTPWYSTANAGEAMRTREGGDLRCYLRDGDQVYQTYETKWRGIEVMLPTLQLLDLTPYGRQETWEDSPAGWPQVKAGSWWRRDGRPVAQWTRTTKAIEQA
jgi:predicted dithiol-disulfide oxidoreductase (DUF899 family)